MTYAIQGLWITSLVLSHLLGAFLLLYAIEKVNGGVSRTLRRLLRRPVPTTPRTPKGGAASPFADGRPKGGASLAASRRAASSSMLYADDSVAGGADKPTGAALAPAWVRGCGCEVSESDSACDPSSWKGARFERESGGKCPFKHP